MHDLRALVVDDSKVGRLTMLKKLEAIGVRVDLTESGQQALDYLAQNQPDLIFMDHMMPDMDGFEVTRRIKAAPATRGIPVFIVSGSDDEAFVQQARAVGATNAITKPPAAGVLETILGSLPKPGAGAVAETAPQPAVAGHAPIPSMDRAAVHTLVEQLLGGAMDHLHEDLMADIRKQVEAEFEAQRRTLQELSERWREQLDQTAAGLAELRRGVAEAEMLGQHMNAVEQRLNPLEAQAGRPLPDVDALRQDVEQRIASRLAEFQARTEHQAPQLEDLRQALLARVEDQDAQAEQRVGELGRRLDSLAKDVGRLVEDAQSGQTGFQQRIEAMETRLEAAGDTEAQPGPDAETLLAAVDEHISPQLEEMRNAFAARLEERMSMPLEDAVREGLLAPLREQLEALRADLDGERARAETVRDTQDDLRDGLSAQGEALQAKLEEARESLIAQYEQAQAQWSAGLEAQQSLQVSWDENLGRLQALEARLDAIGQPDVDDAVQRVLEQRIAQMREVIGAALQPAYPDTVGGMQTRREVGHDSGERTAQPPVDGWNDRLQAELDQLRGRVKTLSVTLAIGGVVLLAAIGMFFLKG